jgi:hypothetical protein
VPGRGAISQAHPLLIQHRHSPGRLQTQPHVLSPLIAQFSAANCICVAYGVALARAALMKNLPNLLKTWCPPRDSNPNPLITNRAILDRTDHT